MSRHEDGQRDVKFYKTIDENMNDIFLNFNQRSNNKKNQETIKLMKNKSLKRIIRKYKKYRK